MIQKEFIRANFRCIFCRKSKNKWKLGHNQYWTMRKIIELLKIDKSFVFEGSREDFFFKFLKDQKSINYEVVTFDEIELSPDVSYGTLFIGSFGFGISVKAFLSQIEDNRLKINFKTKIRVEH